MTDDAALPLASLADLARTCARETELFVQRLAFDARYCFELFRRAIVDRSQRAWELLYGFYSSRVEQWVRRDGAFAYANEDALVFVNSAFARFWSSITPDRFSSFPSLAAILKYLQVCAHSAIMDHLRAAERTEVELDDERQTEPEQSTADPDEAVDRERLWRALDVLLISEAERRVMYDSFVLDLTPRQVQARHPHLFPTTRDVYRVKQNVLSRLRRNEELRNFKT